jgi:hypothetical protein
MKLGDNCDVRKAIWSLSVASLRTQFAVSVSCEIGLYREDLYRTFSPTLVVLKIWVFCCLSAAWPFIFTLRKVHWKYFVSFKIWRRTRMEKIGLTYRLRNKEVSHRVKDERNIIHTARQAMYCNVKLRRFRLSIVSAERVFVDLICQACNTHALYYIVICGLPGCTIFYHIVL